MVTPTAPSHDEVRSLMTLRRCFLIVLYEAFRADGIGFVSVHDIEKKCQTNPQELNWNLNYLKLSGYVDFTMVNYAPYLTNHAQITYSGIYLVEDDQEFDRRFPLVKIDQQVTVHGPHIGHIQAHGTIAGDIRNSQAFLQQLEEGIKTSPDLAPEERGSLLEALAKLTAHPLVLRLIDMLGGLG